MASVTIASYAIPNWQRDGDVELRIYALSSFLAADGTAIVQGCPSEDEVEAANFFLAVPCSLSGNLLTISSVSLESTLDSEDNPGAAYGAYFYSLEGERIGPFGEFASFHLPASPTSTSWPSISLAQSGAL